MAEGCTVQQVLTRSCGVLENYISRFDQVDMFRTRITSYDNAQIEIKFKPEFEYGPFPAMLKQELTSAAINFGGATWYIRGIDDNTSTTTSSTTTVRTSSGSKATITTSSRPMPTR